MKRFILMAIAMVMTLSVTNLSAAPKKEKKGSKIETVSFVTSIDCDHCVKKVMNFMPTQKGIKEVVVDLPTKVIKVGYDNRKSSEEAIIKLFDKIDVEAKVITECPVGVTPAIQAPHQHDHQHNHQH